MSTTLLQRYHPYPSTSISLDYWTTTSHSSYRMSLCCFMDCFNAFSHTPFVSPQEGRCCRFPSELFFDCRRRCNRPRKAPFSMKDSMMMIWHYLCDVECGWSDHWHRRIKVQSYHDGSFIMVSIIWKSVRFMAPNDERSNQPTQSCSHHAWDTRVIYVRIYLLSLLLL